MSTIKQNAAAWNQLLDFEGELKINAVYLVETQLFLAKSPSLTLTHIDYRRYSSV